MRVKNTVLISIVFLQITTIGILGVWIRNKTNVQGTYSISPLNKGELVATGSSELRYMFEFTPSILHKQPYTHFLTEEVSYAINADTLNALREYDKEKKDTTYRIMALGDSFTFGLLVNTDENWVSLLENRLNTSALCKGGQKIEVINLGNPGNDIQHTVERYRLRGHGYQSDLLLWLLKHDDFTDINELMRKNQERYILEMKESGEYDRLAASGDPYPFGKYLIEDMKKITEEIGEENLFKMQQNFLEQIYTFHPKKLVVLYIPSGDQKYQAYLVNLAERRDDTEFVELTNTFKQPDLTFAPYDYHPNVKGHRLIADDVYEYLVQSRLTSCG